MSYFILNDYIYANPINSYLNVLEKFCSCQILGVIPLLLFNKNKNNGIKSDCFATSKYYGIPNKHENTILLGINLFCLE